MKRVHRQYKSGPSPIAQFNLFQHNLHTYFFYELPIILVWSFCLAWTGIIFGFGDECSFLRFYKIVISVSFCKKKAMEILELSVWNSSSWFALTSLVPILVWYWTYWHGTESPFWPFAFEAPFILLIYSVSNLSFFNQTRTNLVCFICSEWF